MSSPSWIAGLGIVSAIGNGLDENLESLITERPGIGDMKWLSSVHVNELPVGEVKSDSTELALATGLSPGLPRTALLSCLAAREALADAGWKKNNRLRTGFISTNTSGGRLADVVFHECGAVSELVADHLGIRHFVSTVSTACSSSANAIFTGARMIRAGLLDYALVGGADALTRFTLNGFNTLMILDKEPCKPFDENRHGLNPVSYTHLTL